MKSPSMLELEDAHEFMRRNARYYKAHGKHERGFRPLYLYFRVATDAIADRIAVEKEIAASFAADSDGASGGKEGV